KANLGNFDRIARAIFAIVVAALYFSNVISGTVAIVLGAVAAILLVTSVISFCPIYAGLKISSKK
ncbi:MAG: DUF2892 domain-containing protein, partial [Leptospiraceae bacterium]|nr:DUF2892 domain-containing protein [Leptospiraceae bacterium]